MQLGRSALKPDEGQKLIVHVMTKYINVTINHMELITNWIFHMDMSRFYIAWLHRVYISFNSTFRQTTTVCLMWHSSVEFFFPTSEWIHMKITIGDLRGPSTLHKCSCQVTYNNKETIDLNTDAQILWL